MKTTCQYIGHLRQGLAFYLLKLIFIDNEQWEITVSVIRIENISFIICRTALAEAELQYNEKHKSTAVYVQFPLIYIPDVIKNHIGMV